MVNKLLKIASAGLLLWKFYHEKKSYNAQMAQYEKDNKQYQKDNDQYHEDLADYMDKKEQSINYKPLADDLIPGVTFQYYLYLRHWNYSETRIRLVLVVKNTSDITYRFQNIDCTPYVFGQASPSYAICNSYRIPAHSQVNIQEWNWSINRDNVTQISRKQPSDGYTDDDVILATGEDWEKLKKLLGDNDYEENGWYVLRNAPIQLFIKSDVSFESVSGRLYDNAYSYSHKIEGNGKLYYTARGTY